MLYCADPARAPPAACGSGRQDGSVDCWLGRGRGPRGPLLDMPELLPAVGGDSDTLAEATGRGTEGPEGGQGAPAQAGLLDAAKGARAGVG